MTPEVKKIAIIGSLALVGVAVLAYLAKQLELLQNACYTVAGAIIHEISGKKMSFTMLLNISNKSDIDFMVTNQKYNIYVNGMLVAVVQNPNDIKVRAKGMSTVNIEIDFNPQDLLKKGIENIAMLIANKNNIVIEVKGYLSLEAGIVNLKNYEVDERLSLKELLAPSVKTTKC